MPGFKIEGTGGNAPSNPSAGDWLRSHRYELVTFFDINPTNDTEFLALKDATLPQKTIDTLNIKMPGTTYSFASQVSYGELFMRFYGSRKLVNKINELHDGAENAPHNLNEGIRDFGIYKGMISFILYDTGSGDSGITFNYSGCFITKVDYGQVSYGLSDIKDIGVSIAFDFFEVDAPDG